MRQPKPFFRKFTKTWYVTLNGKQINLGPDKSVAFQKYHDLMARRGRAMRSYASVAHLFDAYVDWLHAHRSSSTFEKAKHYLTSLARFPDKRMTVERMQPGLLLEWVEAQSGWSDSTSNDAISIVQRAFNWAAKRGHIDRSPVSNVEGKPPKRRREVVFTPLEWAELRGLVKDQEFGDLLDFMWETGCRPIEVRTIEARLVDLKNRMIVFPPSRSKGKRNERVIFLTEQAMQICRRLSKQFPTGPIFRNTRGGPWTKDAINCRFQRLKDKLGRPVCAYAIRHSYATEGLKQGIDSLTLAQLMGHADTNMLAKHYAHLARDPKYLSKQAERLRA